MTLFIHKLFITCDAPRPWGLYFQDSASPQTEALVELHDNIMFYLVIILFGVAWVMISIIRNHVSNKSPISNKYLNHGTLIELISTITPALILIFIAFPSFKLLYLMDEVTDPSLTLFVEGHQWYWSYQYPDFIGDDNEELEFDSYLVPESDLENGALRMLEVEYDSYIGRLLSPHLLGESREVELSSKITFNMEGNQGSSASTVQQATSSTIPVTTEERNNLDKLSKELENPVRSWKWLREERNNHLGSQNSDAVVEVFSRDMENYRTAVEKCYGELTTFQNALKTKYGGSSAISTYLSKRETSAEKEAFQIIFFLD